MPRLRLLGASVVRGAFEIRFCAIWAEPKVEIAVQGGRDVSVIVALLPRPRVEFPHLQSHEGESLGDERLDAYVRERAALVVAYLDASVNWAVYRRRAHK